jgi:hypothetical protein
MIEGALERKGLAAINAEEKEIEELIVQQDARIIFALRKGEEISLEAEKEALRLRGLLSDIKTRKHTLLKTPADPRASASHLRSKQGSEKNRVRRRNGIRSIIPCNPTERSSFQTADIEPALGSRDRAGSRVARDGPLLFSDRPMAYPVASAV